MYVPDRATMKRPLQKMPSTESTITVESCRNDACVTQRLVRKATGWEPESESGSVVDTCGWPQEEGAGSACPVTDQQGSVEVHWHLNGKDPKDGDRYRVKVIEEKSNEVLLEETAIATYTETEHNGEGCGVTKTADL